LGGALHAARFHPLAEVAARGAQLVEQRVNLGDFRLGAALAEVLRERGRDPDAVRLDGGAQA